MEFITSILDFLKGSDIVVWVTALNGLFVALIAFFSLIPGEQPEKFLRWLVDIISKFSKK